MTLATLEKSVLDTELHVADEAAFGLSEPDQPEPSPQHQEDDSLPLSLGDHARGISALAFCQVAVMSAKERLLDPLLTKIRDRPRTAAAIGGAALAGLASAAGYYAARHGLEEVYYSYASVAEGTIKNGGTPEPTRYQALHRALL